MKMLEDIKKRRSKYSWQDLERHINYRPRDMRLLGKWEHCIVSELNEKMVMAD
jgi:hypothetical protein